MFNRNWRRPASPSKRSWCRTSTLGCRRRWHRHCSQFRGGDWFRPPFHMSCIVPQHFWRTESKTCKHLERRKQNFSTLCTGFCCLQLKNVPTEKKAAKRSWWILTTTCSQFQPSRWVQEISFQANISDSNLHSYSFTCSLQLRIIWRSPISKTSASKAE